MSTETNIAICRRMIDQVYNQKRPDLIPEFYTEDVVYHLSGADHDVRIGIGDEIERMTMALTAFPDLQLTVDDEIAQGEKVVFRWTVTGTHQGEFMSIAPTGKMVTRSGSAIYRLVDGKIAEFWLFADDLDLLRQLGALPAPE
jgi:steroid delta-isomerase-like uncharacterized protein